MKFLTSRRGIAHVCAMIVVGMGIMLPQREPAQAQVTLENALLVSNRDLFRACLEVSPALLTKAALIQTQVTQGLEKIRQHKDWIAAGMGKDPPHLTHTCGVQVPARAIDKGHGNGFGRGLTTRPLPFRTIIIVLDQTQADVVLGADNAKIVPYEMMRGDDHTEMEVTTALVVREDFLSNPAFIDPYLTLASGLQPTTLFNRPADVLSIK